MSGILTRFNTTDPDLPYCAPVAIPKVHGYRKVRILAIDPGIRNMAMVLYEIMHDGSYKLLHAGTIDLLFGQKYSKSKHTSNVLSTNLNYWLNSTSDDNNRLKDLEECTEAYVLIESQMRKSLNGIASILHAFYHPFSLIIHPLTYKGDRGGHTKNKITSVDWLKKNCPTLYKDLDNAGVKKKDDVADAVRLAYWGMNNLKDLSKRKSREQSILDGVDFSAYCGIVISGVAVRNDHEGGREGTTKSL